MGWSLDGRGDFNVIRFVKEKKPIGRITRSMRDFANFVSKAELFDSLLSNACFTWTNGQTPPDFVQDG